MGKKLIFIAFMIVLVSALFYMGYKDGFCHYGRNAIKGTYTDCDGYEYNVKVPWDPNQLEIYYDSTYNNLTKQERMNQECHNQIINSSGVYRAYNCSP